MKKYILTLILSITALNLQASLDTSLLHFFTSNNYVGYISTFDKKGVNYYYGFTNFQILPNCSVTAEAKKYIWGTNFIKNVTFKGNVITSKIAYSNSISMYVIVFFNGKASDGSKFRSVLRYHHLYSTSNTSWQGDIYLAKGKKYFGGGSIAYSP